MVFDHTHTAEASIGEHRHQQFDGSRVAVRHDRAQHQRHRCVTIAHTVHVGHRGAKQRLVLDLNHVREGVVLDPIRRHDGLELAQHGLTLILRDAGIGHGMGDGDDADAGDRKTTKDEGGDEDRRFLHDSLEFCDRPRAG